MELFHQIASVFFAFSYLSFSHQPNINVLITNKNRKFEAWSTYASLRTKRAQNGTFSRKVRPAQEAIRTERKSTESSHSRWQARRQGDSETLRKRRVHVFREEVSELRNGETKPYKCCNWSLGFRGCLCLEREMEEGVCV